MPHVQLGGNVNEEPTRNDNEARAMLVAAAERFQGGQPPALGIPNQLRAGWLAIPLGEGAGQIFFPALQSKKKLKMVGLWKKF
jgi:hypothetical protein